LNRSIQRTVYNTGTPAVFQGYCPPRTTLSTELTPAESTKYMANTFRECVQGQAETRRTYQGGVSQEEIEALMKVALNVKNYSTESMRLAAESSACPGYSPPFSSIVPPIVQCPPLPPPPRPPMIPGVDPKLCFNKKY
jgi:hypothetical protein